MIGLPFDAGTVHDSAAPPLNETATTPLGAPGTPEGAIQLELAEELLWPTALMAITANS